MANKTFTLDGTNLTLSRFSTAKVAYEEQTATAYRGVAVWGSPVAPLFCLARVCWKMLLYGRITATAVFQPRMPRTKMF